MYTYNHKGFMIHPVQDNETKSSFKWCFEFEHIIIQCHWLFMVLEYVISFWPDVMENKQK